MKENTRELVFLLVFLLFSLPSMNPLTKQALMCLTSNFHCMNEFPISGVEIVEAFSAREVCPSQGKMRGKNCFQITLMKKKTKGHVLSFEPFKFNYI